VLLVLEAITVAQDGSKRNRGKDAPLCPNEPEYARFRQTEPVAAKLALRDEEKRTMSDDRADTAFCRAADLQGRII
jgi:hypothetical protein